MKPNTCSGGYTDQPRAQAATPPRFPAGVST